MSLEEHKAVMLNILENFTRFCDKNNLMYFLDAGTLIGAVRHKGFIPWDDDIDVCMPMTDYDKFIKLTKENNGFLSTNIQVEYPNETIYPFLKISDDRTVLVEFPDKYPMEVGVYIDVFPKYGIKDNSFKSKTICKISEYLWLIHWFNKFCINKWAYSGKSKILKLLASFLKIIIFSPNWAVRVQDKVMHLYAKINPVEKCKFVTTLTNGEFHKIAPVSCFSDFQYCDFEGAKYKIPIDYDTYLHCLYKGDYMEIPSEENRIHHNIEVYWK